MEFSYPQSVSVGAGQKTTFTVTVRIDPSKLEKTRDPSMYPNQDSVNYSTGTVTISGAASTLRALRAPDPDRC